MNIVAKPASPAADVPESVETVIAEFLSYSGQCVAFCEEDSESFFALEIDVLRHAFHLGCLLLKIYLVAAHRRFDYSKWLDSGLYYLKKQPIGRTIKTFFGEVRYHRCYLVRKDSSGGFYPLDTVLGLTRDGFSPFVIKLTAKLATRVSFATSVILFTHKSKCCVVLMQPA